MSKSVSSAPGQLLKQEQCLLTLSLRPRDKPFPAVAQSQHPLLLLTPQSTICSHEWNAVLHPAQLYMQPVGHFHDDTSWKWNNQTLQCRKKYLILSGWSYSTNIFLLCLAREVFFSVSGICTEPSMSPPQHVSCWPPGAKCKPSVCLLFYRLWL